MSVDGQAIVTLEELEDERGMVVTIDKLESLSPELHDTVNYASQFGIKGESAINTLSWDVMEEFLRSDVQFGLLYAHDLMSDEDADRFTSCILEYFDPDTTEIHVNFRTKMEESGRLTRNGWNACTESTCDYLYILKDKHRIGVCWAAVDD